MENAFLIGADPKKVWTCFIESRNSINYLLWNSFSIYKNLRNPKVQITCELPRNRNLFRRVFSQIWFLDFHLIFFLGAFIFDINWTCDIDSCCWRVNNQGWTRGWCWYQLWYQFKAIIFEFLYEKPQNLADYRLKANKTRL